MSHCGQVAIYVLKYCNASEEFLKPKYFSMQKYNLQKNPLKENQNPSSYYNSVTNLKFQHKPKYHNFKNPHYKNRPINYYLGAKIP